MKLVSENINEMSIKHLSPKTEEEINKYYEAHPAQGLQDACKEDDLQTFIRYLEKGTKLSASHIKDAYYNEKYEKSSSRIITWLKRNQDKLSKYNISENILKNLKQALNIVLLPGPKVYPLGYKQWRVLNFIKDAGKKGTTRTECVKLIFELGYGPGSYNPFLNASYWSTNFSGVIGKYTEDSSDGKMVITEEGKEKIKKLDKRFKDLKVNAYV